MDDCKALAAGSKTFQLLEMLHVQAADGRAGHRVLIGRFRCITWVKCPYRVVGKASALHAGQRAPG